MCDKPPLKYSTEVTDEFYYKYRNLPASKAEEPPFWNYVPRSLTYPNDKNMLSKTMDGVLWGCIPGFTHAFLFANHETGFRTPMKTTLPIVGEMYLKYMTPWVLAGGAFGLATSMSANYRNKEDPYNYAIGGAAGGSVFGMWFKNVRMGFWFTLAGALGFGIHKWCKDVGADVDGEYRRLRVFNSYRRRWFTDPIPPEGDPDYEVKPWRP